MRQIFSASHSSAIVLSDTKLQQTKSHWQPGQVISQICPIKSQFVRLIMSLAHIRKVCQVTTTTTIMHDVI